MKILLILNDAPYGIERSYNALRLAQALIKEESETELTVFLFGDAVTAARRDQDTPGGFYNMEIMLKRVLEADARVLLCGTCMSARAMAEDDMIDGAQKSSMDELAEATREADKVIVF